ncbi:hypothetical protein C8Q70DRAFT_909779, partial [Cubamyces menziesii]
EDYDLGGPPMARYSDYPASVASSQTQSQTHGPSTPSRSPNAPSFGASPSLLGPPMDPNRTPTPSGSGAGPVPHLMGMRAESGSIFREAVWPPPSEHSALLDPIVSASSAVDLGRIVDDVMGSGSGGGSSAAGAGAPSAYRGAASANASRTSMVPDDPFASFASLNAHSQSQSQSQSSPPSAMHSRETSETPLLPKTSRGYFDHRGATPEPPGSPVPMPRIGPLFVTNMDPLSPALSTPGSPPPSTLGSQPRNWLERSPKKAVRPSLDKERTGGATSPVDADVTEVGSAEQGIGEAL